MDDAGSDAKVGAKLAPPRIQAVVRERLACALAPLWRVRLGMVVGPAGSGKTTLLAQFAARVEAPLIWYRADVRDGSASALLASLARGAGPRFGAMRRNWSTVDDMVRAFEDRTEGGPALLIVDDLHFLEGSPAEECLARLVEDAPESLAILMASRRPPSFNVSRLRLSGSLLEVGPDDLRFRSWEVEELFRDFYREPMSPEDLAALTRRTGGWAAGLQLFHLATQGKPARERQRVVRSLAARSRLVREYLARNVLDELPSELTNFMLSTSVLGRMTGPLCDDFLEILDSAAKLNELERRQVFTTAIDGGDVYVYHDVLQGHLRTLLVERDGEAGARALYRRAAPLLIEHGMLAEALRAFGHVEDWEKAEDLLRSRGEEMIDGPAGWLDGLPGRLVDQDPWLQLAMARRSLAAGHWSAAIDGYRRAERSFEGTRGAETCRRERLALAGWLEPSSTPPTDWTGLVRMATQRDPGAARDRALLGSGVPAQLAAGLSELLAGNLHQAQRLLSGVVEAADAGAVPALGARIAWVLAAALAGTPADPSACERLARFAEELGSPWLTHLARALMAMTAGTHGSDEAARFRSSSEANGDDWGAALAGLIEGFGLLQSGGAAAVPLERSAVRFQRVGAGVLQGWCLAGAALARARAGDPEAASAARHAETLARVAGVRGARVLAIAALGLTGGVTGASEYSDLAAGMAEDCGLVLPDLSGATVRAVPLPTRRPLGVSVGAPSSSGAPVEIRCFGQFGLWVHGRPIDGSSVKPRARAALRFLAVHAPRAVHREALLEALWPDVPPAVGIRNLHVVISSLRHLLEPGVARGAPSLIDRDGESYRFRLPPEAVSDLVSFDAEIASGHAARRRGDYDGAAVAFGAALDLYRDELLADEGPAEWTARARERYRTDAVDAAQSLAEIELEQGRAATAATAADRGLRLDRYRDQLWRLRLAASHLAGDLAECARIRLAYREVLVELGVDIDIDTAVNSPLRSA